jgi:hypothetical protein
MKTAVPSLFGARQRPFSPQIMRAPQPDLVDEHWVILGGLLFFLAMAIFAALGFQP